MDEHIVQRVMSAKPAKNLSGKVVYASLYHELQRGKDVASQALATAKIDTTPSAFLRSEIGHVLAQKKRKEARDKRRLAKKKRAARRKARRRATSTSRSRIPGHSLARPRVQQNLLEI